MPEAGFCRCQSGAFMKKSASIYLFAFILFAAGLGYLFYGGFSENSVYFLNVAEARESVPEKLQQARLFGVVSPDELTQSSSSVSFRLLDKDDASLHIPVTYNGPAPDTFKPGAEVIVEGGMAGSGYFLARTLMTKCPSKYKKENRAI